MTDCPLYRAEHIAWPQNVSFGFTVPDPQVFVDRVCNEGLGPFAELRTAAGLPDTYVTVTRGAPQQTGCALARVAEGHIDLPPGPPSAGLLIHEIAHLCTANGEAHSHAYCASYLKLTRFWLGEVAARILLKAMRETRAFP